MKVSPEKKRFQIINKATIIALFILILAGGVVRSTGSGMGCPDWPKCFDQYIPPTSVTEIPKDYKDKYVAKRLAKNQRFAHTLDIFGFSDLAVRIRNDKSILLPEDFNAAKTWTEYINRLIGVVSGFLLLLTVVYSFAYLKDKKRIVVASIFNLILVGFQGWLGGIVVSTNLVAWIVTVHMLLALAILAVCIYTYHAARLNNYSDKISAKPIVRFLAFAALLLSIVQITYGTEVRERIDAISGRLQGQSRESWIADAGSIFTNHRDLALLVLVANVMLYALIRRGFSRHSVQQQVMSFSFLMIMLQIVTGIILSYQGLPPAAQAIHIVLASLVFGAQFYLMLNLYRGAKVWGSN
ncbi:cytochrome c oxidase assembly protein subunit 15 [Mucilaginibacter gracilis]|uniref:Cytochrome c oxidase assembly protein subunit 15 n=1 Tax=Mucilaginibacter gracilis TaxID=423350 RepID=A0A495IXJ3_9SPHI|nr:COX15/CtaA family protein [Mucilaginibacter gracilis]RKR81427.1 cytochrome c oxidase assembly protein subunit 15 [Mucilaginibacter gracilis]